MTVPTQRGLAGPSQLELPSQGGAMVPTPLICADADAELQQKDAMLLTLQQKTLGLEGEVRQQANNFSDVLDIIVTDTTMLQMHRQVLRLSYAGSCPNLASIIPLSCYIMQLTWQSVAHDYTPLSGVSASAL